VAKSAKDLTRRNGGRAAIFVSGESRECHRALSAVSGAVGECHGRRNRGTGGEIFQAQDFTDLQVLSRIGWFDEYFLAEKDIAELIRKGRNYTLEISGW